MDSVAPQLKASPPPQDITVGCKALPESTSVIFTDNCFGDTEVWSTDSEATGDACGQGQIVRRTWKGPEDTCGNKADDIVQTIIMKDEDGPKLPNSMPTINLTCPSQLVLSDLKPPEATDDCGEENVSITNSASFKACDESTDITWTATDQCGTSASVTQKVTFTGGATPSISCPASSTIPKGGGSLNHTIDHGICFSKDDITITIKDMKCSECKNDGTTCTDFEYSMEGTEIKFTTIPALSSVTWTAELDYGCGKETVQCSATVPNGPTNIFGQPEQQSEIISETPDTQTTHWGWYKKFTFGGGKNGADNKFTLWGGAKENNANKEGIKVGSAIVHVSDCTNSLQSSATWHISDNNSGGICVDTNEKRIHVGTSLPKDNKDEISFATIDFENSCCEKDKECYIIVHSKAEEITCSGEGGKC